MAFPFIPVIMAALSASKSAQGQQQEDPMASVFRRKKKKNIFGTDDNAALSAALAQRASAPRNIRSGLYLGGGR